MWLPRGPSSESLPAHPLAVEFQSWQRSPQARRHLSVVSGRGEFGSCACTLAQLADYLNKKMPELEEKKKGNCVVLGDYRRKDGTIGERLKCARRFWMTVIFPPGVCRRSRFSPIRRCSAIREMETRLDFKMEGTKAQTLIAFPPARAYPGGEESGCFHIATKMRPSARP